MRAIVPGAVWAERVPVPAEGDLDVALEWGGVDREQEWGAIPAGIVHVLEADLVLPVNDIVRCDVAGNLYGEADTYEHAVAGVGNA